MPEIIVAAPERDQPVVDMEAASHVTPRRAQRDVENAPYGAGANDESPPTPSSVPEVDEAEWKAIRAKAMGQLGWTEDGALISSGDGSGEGSGEGSEDRERSFFSGIQEDDTEEVPVSACKRFFRPLVKPIVFGGLDGIITTFSVVAAAQGAEKSVDTVKTVLILGFANLLADGFSMGFGEFLGSQAEKDAAKAHRKDTHKQIITHPRRMLARLAMRYREDMSDADAVAVVTAVSRNEPTMIDAVTAAEHGVVSAADGKDEEEGCMDEFESALAMFLSFVVFGMVPLFPWLGMKGGVVIFSISCVLVAITLFVLGAVRGRLTKQNWGMAGLIMLLNGCFVAGLSYLVGWGLSEAVGE